MGVILSFNWRIAKLLHQLLILTGYFSALSNISGFHVALLISNNNKAYLNIIYYSRPLDMTRGCTKTTTKFITVIYTHVTLHRLSVHCGIVIPCNWVSELSHNYLSGNCIKKLLTHVKLIILSYNAPHQTTKKTIPIRLKNP